MKRWIRLAVGLYPPDWRNRYGAEFGALLEDVGPGWRDFWDVLRGALAMQMKVSSFGKVTAACGLAGAMIAAVVAFQMDNRYVSYTVLRLSAPAGATMDDGRAAEQFQQLEEELLSRSFLTNIIQSKDLDLYKRERQHMPLEDIVQSMKTRDIQIRRIHGGQMANVFQVLFKSADPVSAQAVTSRLAERMIDLNLARTESLPKSAVPDRTPAILQVLDPANVPESPVSPNRPVIAGLGLIGGLVLGAVLMGVRRWRLS